MGRARGAGLRRRFLRLGQVSQSDFGQYTAVGSLLAATNATIKGLEAQILQMSSSGTVPEDFARGVIEARNRYNTLLQAYIYAYSTAFGAPPNTTGLEFLGQWQTYVAAGVGIAVILAGIYELNKYLNTLQQQAQTLAAAQAQAADLQNRAAQAYQTGDTATGDQLAALAQQQANVAAAPLESFGAFFQRNWGWFLAGAAGLILLPRLAER